MLSHRSKTNITYSTLQYAEKIGRLIKDACHAKPGSLNFKISMIKSSAFEISFHFRNIQRTRDYVKSGKENC